MSLYKFGTIGPDGSDAPYFYDDIYQVEETARSRRLLVAPRKDHIAVLSELADRLSGPYRLLYVLLVGRTGRAEGRYETAEFLTASDLRSFLSTHGPFLEHDGRHHFWIGSAQGDALLVYDQHNVIFAYGPLDEFARVLVRRGLRSSTVSYPGPHTHHYHAAYDAAEDRLFSEREWLFSPLREQDEP